MCTRRTARRVLADKAPVHNKIRTRGRGRGYRLREGRGEIATEGSGVRGIGRRRGTERRLRLHLCRPSLQHQQRHHQHLRHRRSQRTQESPIPSMRLEIAPHHAAQRPASTAKMDPRRPVERRFAAPIQRPLAQWRPSTAGRISHQNGRRVNRYRRIQGRRWSRGRPPGQAGMLKAGNIH